MIVVQTVLYEENGKVTVSEQAISDESNPDTKATQLEIQACAQLHRLHLNFRESIGSPLMHHVVDPELKEVEQQQSAPLN